MKEKGRTITKSYSKPELEDLFYDILAVGKTLIPDDSNTKGVFVLGLALAYVSAMVAKQLNIMDSDDALYVDIHDMPSWESEGL